MKKFNHTMKKYQDNRKVQLVEIVITSLVVGLFYNIVIKGRSLTEIDWEFFIVLMIIVTLVCYCVPKIKEALF